VVWVLNVTETLAHVSLFGHEALFDLSGKVVERDGYILSVSDVLEFLVGNFLVADDCGIVSRDKSGEFGEVRSHV